MQPAPGPLARGPARSPQHHPRTAWHVKKKTPGIYERTDQSDCFVCEGRSNSPPAIPPSWRGAIQSERKRE
eukprot:scaffold148084_cov28-Tisochrysis_lutea.AAC.1